MLEGLKAGTKFSRLMIAKNIQSGPQIRTIIQMAEQAEIPLEFVDTYDLERASTTKKTQGVIGFKRDSAYLTLEELIKKATQNETMPLVCVLDSLNDPHNLGAVARTLETIGGAGIVIRSENAVGVTPGAIRASAGALEYLPVVAVKSIPRAIQELNFNGFHTVGLEAGVETSFYEFKFQTPLAIVVGNEHRGLSAEARKSCSSLVSIPMCGMIDSLNVSVAAALVLYEAFKQHRPSQD